MAILERWNPGLEEFLCSQHDVYVLELLSWAGQPSDRTCPPITSRSFNLLLSYTKNSLDFVDRVLGVSPCLPKSKQIETSVQAWVPIKQNTGETHVLFHVSFS